MDDEPTPPADVIIESRAVFALISPNIEMEKEKENIWINSGTK